MVDIGHLETGGRDLRSASVFRDALLIVRPSAARRSAELKPPVEHDEVKSWSETGHVHSTGSKRR
ncbi:hypothetical protein PCANC_09561 [Puccinia coronata f. sp. avenae]|uniref:Uncharacterized protein n=1 Tax=Puccinia coronata f. sp. avenae TaxID=200324 RepID=A0A2N5V9T1_9BASI|nr:hypothetical protein PCANC_09561 [Puccinia coronata f. sp. avenae]